MKIRGRGILQWPQNNCKVLEAGSRLMCWGKIARGLGRAPFPTTSDVKDVNFAMDEMGVTGWF